MFNAAALHIVGLAQGAVVIDADFRNDENGNALGPGRIAFNAAPERGE